MLKAKIWLCVPPFALCMLDQGITLVGQSPEYWAGHRSLASVEWGDNRAVLVHHRQHGAGVRSISYLESAPG